MELTPSTLHWARIIIISPTVNFPANTAIDRIPSGYHFQNVPEVVTPQHKLCRCVQQARSLTASELSILEGWSDRLHHGKPEEAVGITGDQYQVVLWLRYTFPALAEACRHLQRTSNRYFGYSLYPAWGLLALYQPSRQAQRTVR